MELKKGFKQTVTGVIPETWEARSLLTTVQIATGQVDPKQEPYKSMILVAPDHIESKTGRLLEQVTASNQHAISGKYLFKQGDIVYSKIRPYLQKAVLTTFSGLCSADMYPFTPAQDVESGFIFAVLLSHRFTSFAESSSARSGIPKINRDELSKFVVALPPLPEQRAIANALSDADALLTALDSLIAKKRLVKQGAMQELLTGKRRLSGFSEKWEVKTISEIGSKFLNGGTPSTHKAEYWKGNIPWVTGADIVDQKVIDVIRRFITKEAVNNSSTNVVEKGNLLIVTRTGVGKIAIAPFDLAISQDITGVYIKKEFALPEFLFWHFNYNANSLRNLNQGTSIAGITRGTLLSLSISLPSLPEQQAIAEILSDMDSEINALETRREKTRLLKQGMMQELLTGKIRLV
jgi:type I restriction enzyme S subunit